MKKTYMKYESYLKSNHDGLGIGKDPIPRLMLKGLNIPLYLWCPFFYVSCMPIIKSNLLFFIVKD